MSRDYYLIHIGGRLCRAYALQQLQAYGPSTYRYAVSGTQSLALVFNIFLEPLSFRPCFLTHLLGIKKDQLLRLYLICWPFNNIPATLWPFVNLAGDLISNASVGRRIGQRGESPVIQRLMGPWLIAIFALLSWTPL